MVLKSGILRMYSGRSAKLELYGYISWLALKSFIVSSSPELSSREQTVL